MTDTHATAYKPPATQMHDVQPSVCLCHVHHMVLAQGGNHHGTSHKASLSLSGTALCAGLWRCPEAFTFQGKAWTVTGRSCLLAGSCASAPEVACTPLARVGVGKTTRALQIFVL